MLVTPIRSDKRGVRAHTPNLNHFLALFRGEIDAHLLEGGHELRLVDVLAHIRINAHENFLNLYDEIRRQFDTLPIQGDVLNLVPELFSQPPPGQLPPVVPGVK